MDRIAVPGPPRTVDAAGDLEWVVAEVLHHVDLAAVGPTDPVVVASDGPERRPQALAAGQLDPRLQLPVARLEAALGLDGAGGVGPGCGSSRGDQQMPIAVKGQTAGPARVTLEHSVAGSRFDLPAAQVRTGA